jgi:hypothetical protein
MCAAACPWNGRNIGRYLSHLNGKISASREQMIERLAPKIAAFTNSTRNGDFHDNVIDARRAHNDRAALAADLRVFTFARDARHDF